ncbi:MAG: 4'-phosphopantetheinyl transferase superfamily protein [Acidobacteriota bacterium]|nr:4'-phosphopantetheinyl transferase superfamily protein [Acidobacteriota bacterium]
MKGVFVTHQFESSPVLTSDTPWSSPPERLILGHNEVHVWRAALNTKESSIQSLRRTLSADERARAERFHFQNDRDHFIVARGLLRAILGRYLNVDPSQLCFSYSFYGKPSLARESSGDDLSFNLSHAGELALYAITRGREIGIDVERIRADFANEQIAERFFSLREVAALRTLPKNIQPQGFFNCWTRKEAYIKARGEGLSLPLDQFEVSLVPGEPAALLRTSGSGDHQEASRWSLREVVAPAASYVAAVAVEGDDWQLKYWQWPEQ